MQRTVQPPTRPFHAEVRVPGDKSLSHRALILAAMARGRSRLAGLGPGADVAATAAALVALGVEFDGERVNSRGIDGWRRIGRTIDCGNSGTTMRLLAGALAGRPFRSTLDGDASLRTRPMGRLVKPLEALGAQVTVSAAGTPPVEVFAPEPLRGAGVTISLASAQVRTAFYLAAIQAIGESSLEGPPGFRDHSERWLASLGLGHAVDETAFRVTPGPVPAADYDVPGDPSSAAYLWAAAAMRPGCAVTTPEVSLNAGRLGLLDVLEEMGAAVDRHVTGDVLGDPVGTVRVEGAGLAGSKVDGILAVQALDELPLVGVLAAAAEGETVVRDAGELRHKESDRIATTVAMLRALGGAAEATDDGFVVLGTGGLRGGRVDAKGDHRIAMAAAAAAAAAREPVTVTGAQVAAVSWPGFYEALEGLWSSP